MIYKNILDTWSKISTISHDLLKEHIPFQTQCILEGKVKTAALTSEIFDLGKEVKTLSTRNYQNQSHDYSKQKEK